MRKPKMRIGIARETAPQEKRVIMQPSEVKVLCDVGYQVSVEKNAGIGVYFSDADYESAGAGIIEDRLELFKGVDMLVKLKAPTPDEFGMLGKNILFSMLHHKQNPEYIYYLGKQNVVAVEMESIKNKAGERLIDATDMTGEAGVLYSLNLLKKRPKDLQVLILGYGRVGSAAIETCNKLGMNIKILRKAEYKYISHFLKDKDLLINAITWPKHERENRNYVVTREMLKLMQPGAVILDLAVDFPNPIETCRPTTLSNPWYVEGGIIHVCIYGYPGLMPISSTRRYSKQVLPIIMEIAKNKGLKNIESRSKLGSYIHNAIIDPKKMNWEQYNPEQPERQTGAE